MNVKLNLLFNLKWTSIKCFTQYEHTNALNYTYTYFLKYKTTKHFLDLSWKTEYETPLEPLLQGYNILNFGGNKSVRRLTRKDIAVFML
jgi:hypothetical protein